MDRAWLLPAVVLLTSCVSGPRVDSSGAGRLGSLRRELDARSDDPEALLQWIETTLPEVTQPERRASLELERSAALAAQRKLLSAKTALHRGWTEVAPSVAGVGGEIQFAWAELEYLSGQRLAARQRWDALQGSESAPPGLRDRARASLVVACEAAGEPGPARDWRERLGASARRLLPAARGRLLRDVSPVVVKSMRGTLPTDPRALLPSIHLRGEWRARPLRANHDPMGPIVAITVHHSAMSQPGPGQTPGMLRSIQADHQDDEGWADIAYHFLIDPHGEVWEGRPLVAQGAHAGDRESNRGNIGVCLLGNFETGDVPPAQAAALRQLLDVLCSHFGLSHAQVRPHSDYRSTACPGRYLLPLVRAYEQE